MNTKPTVTIGIPAYNEEQNIVNVLRSILSQDMSNFSLAEIIVISDGSSDQTVKLARSLKSKLLTVISRKDRKGKSERMNELFRFAKSDILVLIDADCVLSNKSLFYMIKTLTSQENRTVVSANAKPVPETTLVYKILSSGVNINRRASTTWKGGNNVYSYRGSMMGVKKVLFKYINLPSTPGTDAYLYFMAKKHKLASAYVPKSVIYYRLPSRIRGHIKQSTRFLRSQESMKNIFGEWTVSEYKIPKKILVKSTISEFMINPIGVSMFILLNFVIALRAKVKKEKISGVWDISSSTKKAIIKYE